MLCCAAAALKSRNAPVTSAAICCRRSRVRTALSRTTACCSAARPSRRKPSRIGNVTCTAICPVPIEFATVGPLLP